MIKDKLQKLKDDKVFKVPPINDGPCDAEIVLNGKRVINLSSNNYLGFANHPQIIKKAKEGLDKYGVGAGAVRTIVGNMTIHEELITRLLNLK